MTARLSPLLLPAALLLPAPVRAEGPRAGAARADITPPTGHPMWGYAARRDLPSVGVRDRLHARALVLEVGKERMALVSLDLGRAPPRASYEAVRARARKEAGVTALFIVASHTHHGPVLELDNWPTPKTSYVRALEGKLAGVIMAAAKELRPARLAVAGKEVAFNRNRHSKLPGAPVDRQMLVLRVEDEHGKAIATAVNFAAHPTMLPALDRRFSADWPGAMAAHVEKETGAPCLFLQGAAGDLSPQAGKARGPEAFGAAVARTALDLAKGARPLALDKATLRAREEEMRFRCRLDLGDPLLMKALGLAFFPELVAFFEREYRDGVRPRLATALLDGRIGFVGVSGELFCGHALSLKRRARLEHLFVFGYCNDYHQYFPTIEAVAEGGYGTQTYIAPAEVGAGERLMDRALVRLFQMRGKLREAPKRKGAAALPESAR
jgi:hypothetical protein